MLIGYNRPTEYRFAYFGNYFAGTRINTLL
jgi:hypothetical protein